MKTARKHAGQISPLASENHQLSLEMWSVPLSSRCVQVICAAVAIHRRRHIARHLAIRKVAAETSGASDNTALGRPDKFNCAA